MFMLQPFILYALTSGSLKQFSQDYETANNDVSIEGSLRHVSILLLSDL